MQIETLGGEAAEVAVIVAIHGNEVCGVRAVERLLKEDPELERPVKFIVANEEALEQGTRYVEEDLNRAFPGDSDADTHERRLAPKILSEIENCRAILDLHSTVSTSKPVAFTHDLTTTTIERAQTAGVKRIVSIDHLDGGLLAHGPVTSVECGIRGSEDAIENAERIIRNFVSAHDVLAKGNAKMMDTYEFYRVTATIEKPDSGGRFIGENFVRVEKGEPFLVMNGETIKASETFWPVLMSDDGHEDIFGYRGEKVDIENLLRQPLES